jgi:EAL domain-containing protein (putative c-di-GMP-specific phosphodiesterase class I)
VAWYVPLVPATAIAGRDDSLAALVEGALRNAGLELLYQPIVAMRNMPGHRYEASLRLRAPDGEYIPPFDFLPVAEERGLVPAIDQWVMETALDRLSDERRHHHRGLRFYVHQSMASAVSPGWIPMLREQISRRDLIKMRPVIQFRFQDVAAHMDAAAERFAELDRLGIKVCLTRFDGEPSALRMVERMRLPLVKLSKGMVAGREADALSKLVEDLHRGKTGVIAAGIDDPQSITHLWGCGVDFIQGNFLQLPSPDLAFDFNETALA